MLLVITQPIINLLDSRIVQEVYQSLPKSIPAEKRLIAQWVKDETGKLICRWTKD
ncbi:hypothetical protein [Aphanothece hegewaldii]|uniref:hypothetical protein n=1 Tax=Aphanothece hegewaldii TaxID=1521625 RepID=UPI0015E6E3F6|nr:hypothetical protein [Aphanothece hegewaldii]